MPPEVEAFLVAVANTLIKLEVLLFYTRNPSTLDTADGIARRLYRSHDQVRNALAELCKSKILTEYELGSGAYHLYSFTEDDNLRRLAQKLNALYHDDPTARIEIIKRIMTWQRARQADNHSSQPFMA